MIDEFKKYLVSGGKSYNTVNSYFKHVKSYYAWCVQFFGTEPNKLYRSNILDFKNYLAKDRGLSARSINAILSALISFNHYLIEQNMQDELVISSKDLIKIQNNYASLAIINSKDVQAFRQNILEKESMRDYALVTLLIYTGLRISEALNIKVEDLNLSTKELIVKNGKGEKQRVVYLNDKSIQALKEYLKGKKTISNYLFTKNNGERLSRSRINQIFNKHSDIITPHSLRHYFCSYALENGFSIHEVANIAGHSNINTTLLYTNPDKETMKNKVNCL